MRNGKSKFMKRLSIFVLLAVLAMIGLGSTVSGGQDKIRVLLVTGGNHAGDFLRLLGNGKCLDGTQQGKQDGANIQLWDYANQANQQWRLKR